MDDAGSSPVGASIIRARGPMDRALSFYLRGSRFESARACQCPGESPQSPPNFPQDRHFVRLNLFVCSVGRLQPGRRRVEEGRWTVAYRQTVVSLPRSSNRTCPFRASGFPTDFTNWLTEVAPDAHRGAVALPASRTQSRSRNWWHPATPPCAGASGNSSLARGRNGRPLDRPSDAFRNQSSSTIPATCD